MAMFVRRELILIVEVWLQQDLPAGWNKGPLALNWRVGKPNPVESNASSREAYTNTKLKEPLYADEVRRHRPVQEKLDVAVDGQKVGSWTVTAMELVRLVDEIKQLVPEGGPQAVAVFHGQLEASDAISLLRMHEEVLKINPLAPRPATAQAETAKDLIERLLGEDAKLSKIARQVATSITFITTADKLPALPGYESSPDWTIADEWLWHLSRGPRMMPDLVGLSQFRKEQVVMDGALRALVTFRGLVLVGPNPDPDPDRGYYRGAEFQVHTLYTDAMVLGMLQRLLVRQLPTEISRVISKGTPEEQKLSTVKHKLLVMRDTYWSVDFGHRGAMDLFLRKFQKAYDMRRSLDSAFQDMDDHLAELQVTTSQGTNALLTILAVIGLPLTLVATAWASWATASGWDYSKWLWLVVVLFVTVIALGVIVTRLELLRESLKMLWSGSIRKKPSH
jgi:hypothetical protein